MPIERPPAARLLAAAGLIGGVPVAVLALLAGSGALAPDLAAWAMLACGASAVALAWLWLGKLLGLAAALRRAAAEEAPTPLPAGRGAMLPAVAEIADGAARLARSLRERREQAERLGRADVQIIEALPDPLLVLGADRAPLRANRAARIAFGAPGPDPVRAPDLGALLRHPALAEAVDSALRDGQPRATDVALPVPVAREFSVQVLPLDPPLADGGRLLVVLADRSRERAVERTRADFVANASHELRTPLASVMGFIETLRGPAEDDPAARARFLGIMAEQSERMRRLIDDLLSLSRIEVNEHTPPQGRVDLAALARQEAAALAPILAARGARLDCALAAAAVAEPADAEQLAQVLRNLLENAVRHGREGGTVRLSVEAAPSGVVLTVADDGPGIPRQHIPRLTERFYRVDRGRSRGTGGTGLGLAIVKHIANRHRGRLTIESEDGKGASFRLWLPGPPDQDRKRPISPA